MPGLLRRRRVLGAKFETTVGTAIAVAAADAKFNVYDADAVPNIEFDEREGQRVFSPLPGTLGAYGGACTFSTDLIGGALDPAWASTFLPACGLKNTAAVYAPSSQAPSDAGDIRTISISGQEDGVLRKLRGCMGNAVFRFTAGKRVVVEFTFTGIWVDVADEALLAPDYPVDAPLRFVSSGLTLGSWSPTVESLTIDLGNEVVLREDGNDSSGYISAAITNRRMTGTMNPEAELVANEDIYGKWLLGTEAALAIDLGSSGNSAVFAAPKLQITNIQPGDRNGMAVSEIEFQLNRSVDAGDDEFELDLSG